MTGTEKSLLEQNVGLVYHIAKNFNCRCDADRDDLIQEGYVALILAANRFDSTKGCKFTTFAGSYIFGKMLTYARKYLNGPITPTRSLLDEMHESGNYKAILSLDNIVGTDEDCTATGYDLVGIDGDFEKAIEMQIIINDTIETQRNKKAATAIHTLLEGKSQRQAAATLGLSPSAVSKMIRDFRRSLKRELIRN